jgi:transposase-like protein
VANVSGAEIKDVIRKNVDRAAHLRTDSFASYKGLAEEYASHEVVNHLDEWVRGDVHTNTAENFFSILKRGINGIYHHVSEAHLPRYLDEFDFRYNTRSAMGYTDSDRTRLALSMIVSEQRPQRGEKLKIELPFEDAIRAALEVRPKKEEVPPVTKRAKGRGNESSRPER